MEKDLYNLSDFIFDNTSSQSNNSDNKGILDICKIEKNLINVNHGMQMMHTDLNLFEDLSIYLSDTCYDNLNATDIRNEYFSNPTKNLFYLTKKVPDATLGFLEGFRNSEDYKELSKFYFKHI